MSQILTKSPSDHFYNLFSSFQGTLIRKMSPPVLGDILGVFVVATLPANGKYPVE